MPIPILVLRAVAPDTNAHRIVVGLGVLSLLTVVQLLIAYGHHIFY